MINLWYENSHLQGRMNGPLKVIINLEESLNSCNIPYVVNDNVYGKNFLLHYDQHGQSKHEKLEHQTCFIGPQFWPFDHYGKFLFDYPEYYNKLIVPSEWVKNLIVEKCNLNANKISIWPVGIKRPNYERNVQYDCLIYFKRRSSEELKLVEQFLSQRNISYNILSYGTHKESDFQSLASQSRFCFLLNGTESQGIAVQEIMSLNVPLLVWDVMHWNDNGEEYKVESTSVPYWDAMCGEKFYFFNELEQTFSTFCDKIDDYTPSIYVENNLSYTASVNKLLEILNVN